jgi:6-pyruvoyl-tetrahydropterin synthase
LDHTVLNESIPVATTAERIAEYIHKETKSKIPEEIELTVTVWETPQAGLNTPTRMFKTKKKYHRKKGRESA